LAPSLSPALDGREIAGTSRRSAPKEGDGRWLWRRRYFNANNFYDTGSWYVVAQCWDVLAIAEELERHEELTSEPFDLDTAAIAHFHGLVHGHPRTRH
jgi:hypothetical protein